MTVEEKIDLLTRAVMNLAQVQGARLTRSEVCDRLRIHRNTLPRMMTQGFPKPDSTGKWLLSEVMEWETKK
jgi:hypothetical protein